MTSGKSMDERKVFLDKPPLFEMKKSSLVNTIYYILYVAMLIIYFCTVYVHHQSGNVVVSVMYYVYGVILLSIPVIRYFLQKRQGRKFIKLTRHCLEVQNSYFQPRKTFSWKEIEQIRFDGSDFVIAGSDAKIKFRVPLEKYLDLRVDLRKFANSHQVHVEG